MHKNGSKKLAAIRSGGCIVFHPQACVRPGAIGAELLEMLTLVVDATKRQRAICPALPEATEKEAWGDPTFRVKDKIFAMEKRGDGRVSVWVKAPLGSQEVLIGAAPESGSFARHMSATRAGSACASRTGPIGTRRPC